MWDTERYRRQAIATLAKYLKQPKETFNYKGCRWHAESECWLLTVEGVEVLYQVGFHSGAGVWEVQEIDLTGMF